MKNLFKNLMLVAVAAMAFVACSQEGIEVNNLTKKTIVEGIASINTDDTRSGFVGSETDENGNTVYKSAWDGDENIKVFAPDYGLETTAIINAEGKFTAEFDGELPEKYYIAVCSPAEAWVSAYTCNIPTVQTPRTDSVDPAAHILSQQGIYVTNGSADPFIMQHQVGYGKMTVNTPAEFVIDYVEVELNGDWYNYAKTLKYTINADNVEDNVFWFATDVVEVSDFTVTAYDAEGNAYTKSVTIPEGRELKFQYGRVSTFSVSNLEKYVAPAFTSAEYNGNVSDKIIKLSGEELGELWINFYGNYALLTSENWINVGQYSIDKGLYFGGNYGQYKPAGYSEWLYSTPNSFTLDVSIVDGQYMFVVNADYSNMKEGVTLVNAVYHGDIEGLDYPDLRTKLPTPVVNTPTVNGKEITLTWSAVDGADGYYVYCTNDSTIYTTTKELTAIFTMPEYGKTYSFVIKAIANDDNPTYRSSDEIYFTTVSTGSDPDYKYEWDTAKARWYNTTNFTIEALTVDGRSRFYFDMYCPSATDKLLPEGTYTSGGDEYYIGYGFIATNVDNPTNVGSVTGAGSTVVIKHLEDGYEFTINAVGNNGSMTTVYTGKVEDLNNSGVINPGDNTGGDNTGGETEFTPDYTITSFEYVQLSSSYYTYQWNLSTSNGLSFRIYTPYSQGTTLQVGTYTYYSGSGYTNGDFTFSTRMFNPAPAEGSMVVSKDGDTYTINLTLVVGSATQKYQYIGTF